MNKDILNTVVQDFINNNIKADITSLLLKKLVFNNVDIKEVVEQIEAKKRCKIKLPTWFNTSNIYYPNKLNIEQTSSEIAAKYKSQLIKGSSIIDLTGGFGVDSFYFSKSFKEVTHCEINKTLSNIVSHNYNQLGVDNIITLNVNGIDYLKNTFKHYDWIYVDPSRRHDSKGKVFYLKDCLPNIPKYIDLLFKHTNSVLLKASPMLDISIGISELKYTTEIHIVAINNDVKELLFILNKESKSDIQIKTINIKSSLNEVFNFNYQAETNAKVQFSEPLTYLYEPNAAILKSGAFKSLAEQLNVCKLHTHSHIYTSKKLIEFPGRSFKIIATIPYKKALVKKHLSNTKINIAIRNFPEPVSQIKKKFKINDGSNIYAFFTTTLENKKIVAICEKA
ncbi:THUMP-like domain-containing protein [Pontimicrobium aquaticum]|uniref:Class I SAM-dependent methyltransferase n=1 Tax=Pontimicrobium aquaticum TaxID=2565367 RepID=A0A4U0EK66_9FLAO|nr:class I SAM-dependent methyltransferase [Pontimicrobium aquaticum]TJY31877.1 class I SAM-dependent methyltransferase [Pontimicrobium aquaticum]